LHWSTSSQALCMLAVWSRKMHALAARVLIFAVRWTVN
jgi:hypothetical protein